MPNRSYVHASWTSIGSLGWIALPPRSSLMKCKASYLRRGWVERNSFPSWPSSESFIWPIELHILFHYAAMNILKFLYPEIKALTPWAWSSILLHHKSHARPWYLRDLSSGVLSRCESYDHLRVSPHRCPLGWLFWVLLIIISMHGSLLHLCTNLAAWTTINQQMVVKLGTTSPLIAVGGIPMVELTTINKALPGDSTEQLLKKSFSLKRSKNMFLSIVCTFWYSWS